ncbi:outer membrane beta-barrel protein [Cytophaga aurantiaca]|uniref:outer membrane beta-barrel protein n=1 Tax=Cytophaga aurantiaca TaxID=29530 RepID=UPI0003768CEC|nr:outer membrane beta-barrel protein [Cytophaga aurantiaca]
MKTRLYSFLMLVSLLVFSNSTSYAQRIELTATGGYQYWGAYKYYNSVNQGSGKLALGDGPCYGGILGFELADATFVELVYNHQDSRLINKPNYGPDNTVIDVVGVNYFQLNGTRGVQINDKVEPFGTLGLGAGLFDPKSDKYHSLWKFSVNFGVGVKYFVSDRIGLRFSTGFWAPIQGVGLGVGLGTGGAYAGASTYTTIIQMNLQGGIIFRLKN